MWVYLFPITASLPIKEQCKNNTDAGIWKLDRKAPIWQKEGDASRASVASDTYKIL